MLPNWLLGKSKSKLQEILGGGGGGATYTAGDGIDISNGVISFDPATAKAQITNPNLLDNPWFTVNQRGQSSYTSPGYTVDRWKISDNIALSLSNGILTLTSTAAYCNMEQPLESERLLEGKTYTLSILCPDDSVQSKSFILQASSNWITIGDVPWEDALAGFYATYRLYNGVYQFIILDSNGASERSASFKAVKLELGSVSTLAMDTAPDMATELVKCQRYFQRLKSTSGDAAAAATGYATATTAIRVEINYSGNMRKQPTASISSPSDFVYTQTNYASGSSPDEIAVFASFGNALSLNLTAPTGTYKQGDVYKIYASGNAYIDLDAEL